MNISNREKWEQLLPVFSELSSLVSALCDLEDSLTVSASKNDSFSRPRAKKSKVTERMWICPSFHDGISHRDSGRIAGGLGESNCRSSE